MSEFKRCEAAGLSVCVGIGRSDVRDCIPASEVEALLEQQAKEMAILQRASDRKSKLLCDWKREQRDRATQDVADTVKSYCETERTVPIKPKGDDVEVKVFKAEDASPIFDSEKETFWHITHDRSMAERIAAHFNRILSEKGVRVGAYQLKESGLTDEHGPGWAASEESVRTDKRRYTHTALLIAIEPIVRESAEDIVQALVKYDQTTGDRRELWKLLTERAKRFLDAQDL